MLGMERRHSVLRVSETKAFSLRLMTLVQWRAVWSFFTVTWGQRRVRKRQFAYCNPVGF